MKVAIATDDGVTVSRHFGRATAYTVATIVDGRLLGTELRAKFTRHLPGAQDHDHAEGGGSAGEHTGPEAQARHDAMLAVITDCSVVVAGGMGMGARDRVLAMGMEVAMTDAVRVDDAIRHWMAEIAPGAARPRLDPASDAAPGRDA
jgi:predicted Fe-Mo cluster-binding NifX family protein